MNKVLLILLLILCITSCSKAPEQIVFDAEEANMSMYTDLQYQKKIGKYLKMDGELLAKKFENKDSFIIMVGHPKCKWCQRIIRAVNEFMIDNNIFVYYLNSRFVTSDSLQFLQDKCKNILLEQKETDGLSIPALIVVKDGEVVGLDMGGIPGGNEYYDDEEIKQLLNRYQSLLKGFPKELIRYDSKLIPEREITSDIELNHENATLLKFDSYETYITYGSGTTFIANQDGPYILYRTLIKDKTYGYLNKYMDEYIILINEDNKELFKENKDNLKQLLTKIYYQTNENNLINEDYMDNLVLDLIELKDESLNLYVREEYTIDYLRAYDKEFARMDMEDIVDKVIETHKMSESSCDSSACFNYNPETGEYCDLNGIYGCELLDDNNDLNMYYYDLTPYQIAIANNGYNWELYDANDGEITYQNKR